MSNPRVDPHPDKWLTAAKVPKQTQRPLVSSQFRSHTGIATPPTTRKPLTSTAAGSTSRKRRAPEATPSAPPAGLRSIQSYLTPPTTGSQPTKKRVSSRLASVSKQHASPTRRSPRLNRDPVATVREWRASLPPEVVSPVKRPRQDASASPSPSIEVLDQGPTTPEAPPSSLPGLTPIPSSVMARHERLCGQDSAQRRNVISPWRRGQATEQDEAAARAARDAARKEAEEQRNAERERKRLRIDAREEVDKKAQKRVRETREKRALGGFKSLAHLSSDRSSSPRASSPSERTPLATKNANSLRRHSSAVVEPVCPRDSKWPQRQPVARVAPIPSAFPSRSQIIPSAFPSRLRITPGASSPSQRVSKSPGPSTTPRKRRVPHHQVTPPKSRTPQTRDQQETLFEFPPVPPRQPVFKPVSPKPISDWVPIQMEAETLMTWSLGAGNRQTDAAGRASLSSGEAAEGDVAAAPIQDDEITSLPGTIPSQYFPNLIASSSSPVRPVRPSKAASPARPSPERLEDHPQPLLPPSSSPTPAVTKDSSREPSSPSPRGSRRPPDCLPSVRAPSRSPTKPLIRHTKRHSERERRLIDHALFSSLSESAHAREAPRVPTFPRPTQNRKSPIPPAKSQSKLEMFGYSRSSARPTREFETSFSDEEDLDFDDPGEGPELGSSPAAGPSRLQLVPSPPPHPSLRPMGIREQAKRQQAALERHRGQRESLRSSSGSPLPPPPSSARTGGFSNSQTDEELEGVGDISESTRAWWDRLARDEPSDDML